jgi:AcrR family transcriptional regulator
MNAHSAPLSNAPRLRQRHREATRAAILEAAEEVYARVGLAGGRMEEIAARAGVSVGTLYNYFADRDDLVDSLLIARRAELLERLDAAAGSAPAEFGGRLRLFLQTLFGHLADHRPFLHLLAQSESSASLIASAAKPSSTLAELGARAGAIVRAGIDQGALRREDPEFLVTALVGMVRAILLRALVDDADFARPEMADRALRMFLAGAGAP